MNIKSQLTRLLILSIMALSIITGISVYGFYTVNKLMTQLNNEASFYQKNLDLGRSAQVEFQRQVQEWKNILIRGNNPDMYARYKKQFDEKSASMNKKLESLEMSLKEHNDDTTLVRALIEAHKVLDTKYKNALDTQWSFENENSGKSVDTGVRGIDRDTSKHMDDLAEQLKSNAEKTMGSLREQVNTQIEKLLLISGVIIGVIVFLFLVLSAKIVKNIFLILGAEPSELITVFKAFAVGDFTVQPKIKEGDKLSMAVQVALTQRKVRNMIVAIKSGAAELENLSKQVKNHENTLTPEELAETTGKTVEGINEVLSRFKV